MIYIFESLSLKNWVASLLALGSVVRLSFYAMQISPIRTLFPILFFGLFIYLHKHNKSIFGIRGSVAVTLLLALAYINNIEISVSCSIGLVAYAVLELVCQKLSIRTCVARIIQILGECIVALGLAIAGVNLYNFLCNGPFVLRTFFFPIIGGDTRLITYVEDQFAGALPLGNHVWEYILIFFLCSLCLTWYMGNNHVGKGKDGSYAHTMIPTVGAMATIGVVAFTYYMNEPLWTDLAVYKQIVYGLLAIYIDRGYRLFEIAPKRRTDCIIQALCMAMISVTIFGSVQLINDPVRIATRYKVGAYNLGELQQSLSSIDISEDIYGVGQGVNIIYHELGVDNHSKYRDSSALRVPYANTYTVVMDEISKSDAIFTCLNHSEDIAILNNLEANGEGMTLKAEYRIGGWEYGVYTFE